MESPAVTRIFRELFSHQTCSRLLYTRTPQCLSSARAFTTSTAARRPKEVLPRGIEPASSMWQPRTGLITPDKSAEYSRFELVTADDLRHRKARPRRVKMLMRDFIEDSLYNPHYGYFSKQVTIFNPGEPFEFNELANAAEFHLEVSNRYKTFEDGLDAIEGNELRPLWHTPTELFRPYYGEALARSMLDNYMLTHHPYRDLIIYEMGAGNGTMMLNILDHIRDLYPEIYPQTQYRIIEISTRLAELQNSHLFQTAANRGHADRVQIINKSIFDWNTFIPEPCWFLALEVFDNFAHDVLRFDPVTKQALQGTVLIDGDGEFYDFYSPELDSVAERFLDTRDTACNGRLPESHPLKASLVQKFLRDNMPFSTNLTRAEYIPTRLMQFFEVLRDYFPHHKLLTSDFHVLPQAVDGCNAPIVQTRYKRKTVPMRSPLVHQGYFDILFPTDFDAMAQFYHAITGKFSRVATHKEFLSKWAYVQDTETQSGENPMLSWYENASVMVTV